MNACMPLPAVHGVVFVLQSATAGNRVELDVHWGYTLAHDVVSAGTSCKCMYDVRVFLLRPVGDCVYLWRGSVS